MVTLRAKQEEEPQWNQQQECQSLRDRTNIPTVTGKDHLKKEKLLIDNEKENNEIVKENSVVNGSLMNFRNDDGKNCYENEIIRLEERSRKLHDSSNCWTDVSCSSGDSIQCSDIKDDDENEEENEDMRDRRNEGCNGRNKNLVMAEEEEENDENQIYYNDVGIENGKNWRRKEIVTTRIERLGNIDETDNAQTLEQQVMPNIDETSFGEVNITNSKHVHVGNTNFYKGPVTIKQFVYSNANPINEKNDDTLVNESGDIDSGRISDVSRNDLLNIKIDPNRPILPTYGDYEKVTKWMWTWRCAAILCVLALIFVTIVVVLTVILSGKNVNGVGVGLPDIPTSETDPDDFWVNSVRFVERNEWIAQPPTEKMNNLSIVPAPYVIISHTATEPCTTQSDCVLRVRLIQTFHIESRGWADIGYNFLVGGDGLAYVGRGWDLEGAHAFGWNKKSIGISFIGTFNDVEPYKRQLHAALKAIEVGVKLGKISTDYKLLGHRQVVATLSPGNKVYEILKTWEHWSPKP